jgi:hypothetical protein
MTNDDGRNPEGAASPERHRARFVVEVIDGFDLSAMVKSYRGSGIWGEVIRGDV